MVVLRLSKRGAVSLGLLVIMVLVIAFVIFVVFAGAIDSYLVGGLNYFSRILGISSGGSGSGNFGTVKTTFTAYNCVSSTSCSTFQSAPYYWYIDYNGQNLSAWINTSISFTTASGNYSFTAYVINESSVYYCSNLTRSGSGYNPAGSTRAIYYFNSASPSC
jgi:hypothetical protein